MPPKSSSRPTPVSQHHTLLSLATTFIQCYTGVPACTQGGGAKTPLRAHLCIRMFLQRNKSWSSKSFLERQCLDYWSQSYTLLSLGSGGLPPKNFLNQTVYNASKCFFTRYERWKELSMKGNSCPSCPT